MDVGIRFILLIYNIMPAKRKITIKKKVKEVEKTPEIEETSVSTVSENEISNAQPTEVDNSPLLVGTASWYDYDLEIN